MDDFQLLYLLEKSRRELVEVCLKATTEVDLRTRPTADEWSVLEVLAHIPAVDRHYLQQALGMLAKKQHIFQYFDEDTWKTTHQDVNLQPFHQVFEDLVLSREEVLKAIEKLGQKDMEQAGLHPRRGRYTVREALLRMPDHDRNHARQIYAILEALSRR